MSCFISDSSPGDKTPTNRFISAAWSSTAAAAASVVSGMYPHAGQVSPSRPQLDLGPAFGALPARELPHELPHRRRHPYVWVAARRGIGGDRFLPKEFWQPLYEGDQWKRREDGSTVGLRSLTIEGARQDVPGYVRTEVAPSVRLAPHGVYVGVNGHFQLTKGPDERGDGYQAARIIEEHWVSTRSLERTLIDRILQAA
jgi:hypothetical protein